MIVDFKKNWIIVTQFTWMCSLIVHWEYSVELGLTHVMSRYWDDICDVQKIGLTYEMS